MLRASRHAVSSPTLFNAGTTPPADVLVLPADSPERRSRGNLRAATAEIAQLSKFAGGIGLAYSRIRSRGSLIRGTNGTVQRHRAVAQDARRSVAAVNQGGKRKGARAGLPGDVARRHRGVPGAARQHRRRGPRRTHNLNLATGSRTSSWSGSRQDGPGRCSTRRRCPQLTDLYGERSRTAYRRPRQGLYARQVKARDLYAADDEDPRGDRQRLDDVQGRLRTARATRPARRRQRRAPVEPVHRNLEVTSHGRNRGLQPGLDQSRAASRRPTFDLDETRARRSHRGHVPGPRHRHQVLPDAGGRGQQQEVAPGRPRRDGPAGRVLPAGPVVRLARSARALAQDQRGDLLPRAVGVGRTRRRRGRIRPSPDTTPPRACSSSTVGRDSE